MTTSRVFLLMKASAVFKCSKMHSTAGHRKCTAPLCLRFRWPSITKWRCCVRCHRSTVLPNFETSATLINSNVYIGLEFFFLLGKVNVILRCTTSTYAESFIIYCTTGRNENSKEKSKIMIVIVPQRDERAIEHTEHTFIDFFFWWMRNAECVRVHSGVLNISVWGIESRFYILHSVILFSEHSTCDIPKINVQ